MTSKTLRSFGVEFFLLGNGEGTLQYGHRAVIAAILLLPTLVSSALLQISENPCVATLYPVYPLSTLPDSTSSVCTS